MSPPSVTIFTFGPGSPGCPVLPLKPCREERAGWGSQGAASRAQQVTLTLVQGHHPQLSVPKNPWGDSPGSGDPSVGCKGVTRRNVTHRRPHHPWWPGGTGVTLGRKRK